MTLHDLGLTGSTDASRPLKVLVLGSTQAEVGRTCLWRGSLHEVFRRIGGTPFQPPPFPPPSRQVDHAIAASRDDPLLAPMDVDDRRVRAGARCFQPRSQPARGGMTPTALLPPHRRRAGGGGAAPAPSPCPPASTSSRRSAPSRPRRASRSCRRRRRARRPLRALAEGEPPLQEPGTLTDTRCSLPPHKHTASPAALALLHRLAADPGIAGVMQARRWRVGLLSEMPPEGKVGVSVRSGV